MIRLILASLFFLASLLVLFKAPTNFFWRLQVAITEFPHIFIMASLALLISCYWMEKYRGATVVIGIVTVILFCIPVLKAYMRGEHLGTDLNSSFPDSESGKVQLPQPFSLINLFTGVYGEDIIPVEHRYKNIDERSWSLDFYGASTATKSPCVISIHGGAWSGGDSKEIPSLNSYLARHGYHVAAINYRLAPEFKSPSPVEDVRDAILYLKAQAEQLNIDTTNFILLGRSAGGQIALCAAYTLNDPSIKGVISFYAPADMVWGANIKGNPLVLNTDETFAAYLGGPYNQFAEKYEESSAVAQASVSSPPTLIIHGENDCMVSFIHSQHLDEKLSELKVPHYFLNIPGATHACDYNLSGPSGQLSTYAIERFLASLTT